MRREIILRIAVVSLPKFLKLTALVLVDALMARYLGVADFGLFSFVAGLFLILNALPKFGLDNIIVRDFVSDEMDGEMLAHVVIIRVTGGIAAAILFLVFVFLTPTLWPKWPYLLALGFSYALFGISVFEPLFQARERFYGLAAAQSLVVLSSAVVKLYLVLVEAPVAAFWTSILLEGAVSVPITLLVVKQSGLFEKFFALRQVSVTVLKNYARRGLPFLMATLSVTLYMRADQIMLTWLVGVESVGLYSAALRISESFFTLGTIACVVFFPWLLRMRLVSQNDYEKGFVLMFRWFFVVGVSISVALTYSADYFIGLLFGEGFRGAGSLLVLHAWVMVPAFWGVVSHRWLVAENLGKFELIRTSVGLALNLLLNLALIPFYGAAGACVATLISQLFAYVALNYILPSLSGLGRMQVQAILVLRRG